VKFMPTDRWRTIDPPRPVSDLEQVTLAEPFPASEALRRQAQIARVNAECMCGCGWIAFIVDRDSAIQADVSERIPLEGRSSVPAKDGSPSRSFCT
jgi:hypothetical protein